MAKKPYEILLERIENAENMTPGNKAGIIDFLKIGGPMMIMSIILSTFYLLILFGGYWD